MIEARCRICLRDTPEGPPISGSICEKPIWMCIAELGSIHVELDDDLPQQICQQCYSDLQSAIELRDRITFSDQKLRLLDVECPSPGVKLETVDVPDEVIEPDVKIEEEEIEAQKPTRKTRAKARTVEPETIKEIKEKKPRPKRGSNPHKCCMCEETCQNESALKEHCANIHPEGRPDEKPLTLRHKFECKYCHRRFRMKRFLSEHFVDIDYEEPKRDRTKDIQYKKNYYEKQARKICSICGLQLRDQRSLEVHEVSKHSTVRNLVCGINGCKAAFGHEIVMRKHKRACHSEKKFTCDYCAKGFVYFRQLKQHIFLHMDKKPYQCTQCDRSYTLKRVLEAHITANHSEVEYPFQCDLCEKAYKWKEDLRSHRSAYHFGKFPFVCKFCGKGYTSSSNRHWHEKRCTLGQIQQQIPFTVVQNSN